MTTKTIPADLTDTRPAGWWTSEDGQRQIDMTGATMADALAELLSQCSDDEQRAGILAGELEVLDTAPIEPTKCLAVVNVPGGRYAYCAVKVYTAQERADGVKTWRAGETLTEDYRSRSLATERATEIADSMGLPVLEVRHGDRA